MRIHKILRQKGSFVATISPDATIATACQELQNHGIGALIVSASREDLQGILSERDITRSLADIGAATLDLLVADLMTREVITSASDETVDHLMRLMTEERTRHVPVVDTGTIVGIVSIGDVVKHRLDELEEENITLHDYIELGR